jgi:redox-regulated HSP33 family molecular chaperone
MVQEAVRVADCSREVADLYGRLLTGTALMQLAQAPIDRVQCAIMQEGAAGMLMADVWPGVHVRGRVEFAKARTSPVIEMPGTIRVTRHSLRGTGVYESLVPMSSDSVSEALQRYVLESEQMLTMLSLATVSSVQTDDGAVTVGSAAGLFVQALPEMEREHLEAMTTCLEKAAFEDLVAAGDDPFEATVHLLADMSPHEVGGDPLEYRCRCSKQTALEVIKTIEIDDWQDGTSESVTCGFCGAVYEIQRSEVEVSEDE